MDDQTVERLSQNIVACHDLTTGVTHTRTSTCINIEKRVCNGFKDPIWRVICGDRLYTKCSKIQVTYKCVECCRENTITLQLFLRKILRNITTCNTCNNLDEVEAKPPTNPMQLIALSCKEFDEMDEDWKHSYFRKYLAFDEFERIRPHIVSFQHGKLAHDETLHYVPALKINNQPRFCPSLYNTRLDTFEKLAYITFRCECCGSLFENKTLDAQKNKHKILCRDCSFSNNTIKIRNVVNIRGAKITYRSTLEQKFIGYCNEHQIEVVNGHVIPYEWNGCLHEYKVGFYLPAERLLVELKDYHIWHKRQVESGKWHAKAAAARAYAAEHGAVFKVIYPTTYVEFVKSLTVKI